MPSHHAATQAIEHLANEWMTAVAERDAATLERILGEEVWLASGMGMFVDRAQWLQTAL